MRNVLVAIACCVAASASVAAQQVWKVHNGSLPGAHFTDLPPAVAAASPNDMILVYHWAAGGTGTYYTATTIDKPLTIVGFSVGPQGPSGAEPLTARFRGLFTITGIAAGERVTLSTCGVSQDTSVYPTTPTGIHVVNCAGEVVLEDFVFLSMGFTNSLLRFENSANVVLRGCDFLLGGSPIDVIDSTMLVTTTGMEHTHPYGYPNYFPGLPVFTQTAEGVRVTNSDVTIVNSIVRGSREITNYGLGYQARRGVHIVTGSVTAGPGAVVRGGAFVGGGETVGYSIADPLTGAFYKDSRAGVPFPYFIPPIPITLHTMLHAWPVAGDVAWFDIWGPSGGFAAVMFGDRLVSAVPTPLGDLWFDPATSFAVDVVSLTAPDGSYHWARYLPLTAPVGYPFVLQAVTLAPTGELSLTVPSPFTVAYPYWIAP